MRDRTITAVEVLLAEGLDLYGRNRVAEAVRRWEEVLVLAPDEARALDYIRCATYAPPPISSSAPETSPEPPSIQPAAFEAADEVAATTVNREVLVELLRGKRYEEALRWLDAELRRRPTDAALARSVALLEDHLARRYERQLGDLDRVLCVQASPPALRRLSPELARMVELVDGRASLRDVLARTTLRAHEARRALSVLIEQAIVGPLRAPRRVPERIGMAPTQPSGSPSRGPAPAEPTRPSTRAPSSPFVPATPAPEPRAGARPGMSPTLPMGTRGPITVTARVDRATDLFNRATEAYLHHEYELAMRLYEECLVAEPSHPHAAHNLGLLRRRTGR
jgi:tetratricopeptide (TPR) repeat protein